jgi:hypothetical protein
MIILYTFLAFSLWSAYKTDQAFINEWIEKAGTHG